MRPAGDDLINDGTELVRASDSLEALKDLDQLRAMMIGKDDTVSYQRGIMDALKVTLEKREHTIEELTQKASKRKVTLEKREHTIEELTQKASKLKVTLEKREHAFKELTQKASKFKVTLEKREHTIEELTQKASKLKVTLEKLLQKGSAQNDGNATLEHTRMKLATISGNYRIYSETRGKLATEVTELESECEAMRQVMQQAPAIYQPSLFWEQFYRINMHQLREVGLSNFKLTVNQNYQNFIPRSLLDPKIRPLLKWFLQQPSIRPFLSVIENPDSIVSEGYPSQPGAKIFHGSPIYLAIYRTLVSLGWEYSRANDPLKLCDHLEEPEVGNPIRIIHNGKLITQDLATSVAEVTNLVKPLQRITGNDPFSVLEIGGGYGRFAHALMSTQPVKKYVIIDIPPALHVSRWYLEQLFPEKKIFQFRHFQNWSEVSEEMECADIVFLLPHQIELLPDGYVDAGVATSSLHEMNLNQANNFLQQMGRLSRHIIISKQYWSYENPYDKLVLKHEDYVKPAGFGCLSLVSDALNPVFFIETLERI